MEKDMPVKLIAVDMDGTLLNQDQTISPKNIQAVRAALDQGIAAAICTGRMAEDASFFAGDAGLWEIKILSMNGGYCLDRPHGEPVSVHYMAREAVEAVMNRLNRSDRIYSLFGRNHVAVNRLFSTGKELETWGSHIERKGAIEYTYGPEGIARLRELGTNKIVCIDREKPESLREIREELETEIPGICVTSSWPNNIEIMPEGTDKGTAVAALARRLQIPMARVMCIGDHDNDVPMLKRAGISVCMANGSDKALAAAKYHTLSNREDGVAAAIWKYALGQVS